MSAPHLELIPGGKASPRRTGCRLDAGQRARNHAMSGTVGGAADELDEPDAPALRYAHWFREQRAKHFDLDAALLHLDDLYGLRLHEAEVKVNRCRLPERKAEAQRRLDALRGEHDAALEAVRERSPALRVAGWFDKRGVTCRIKPGTGAAELTVVTAGRLVAVEATVAGDPELQSRVYAALVAALDAIDPEEEDDDRPPLEVRP